METRQDGCLVEVAIVLATAAEMERAARRKRLCKKAVEQFLNYDEWFSLEVDKGLAAADRGEFVDHGDIRKMIDSRYPA